MSLSQLLVLIVIIALVRLFVVAQTQLEQRVTPTGQCPLQGERRAVIEEISKGVVDTLQLHEHQCGDGMWHHVAYLNMSDPSQQCPSAWWEYNAGVLKSLREAIRFRRELSKYHLRYRMTVQQSVHVVGSSATK
jgi:hypothetical protein